jgi:hypothetical protein
MRAVALQVNGTAHAGLPIQPPLRGLIIKEKVCSGQFTSVPPNSLLDTISVEQNLTALSLTTAEVLVVSVGLTAHSRAFAENVNAIRRF